MAQQNLHRMPPTSSFSVDAVVQCLNNRACVLVVIGDFPKANHLFEAALLKHNDIAAAVGSCGFYGDASVGSGLDHGNLDVSMSGSDRRSNRSTANVNQSMDNYDSDSSSEDGSDSFYANTDDDYDDDEEESDNSTVDSFIDSSANYGNDRYHYQQRQTTTTTPVVSIISRMTMSSQLRTFSYCGQQYQENEQGQGQEKSRYHQVYSLPIVMNEIEWEQASIKDRSFVLIFNSAICNHLWGMELLRSQQREHEKQQQQVNRPFHHRSYQYQDQGETTTIIPAQQSLQIAKALYRLALQHFSHKGINGVDKLCYPAIFNNMSHLCKTLEGYSSSEAYYYDKLLLKAVYWLIDLSSSSSNSDSNSNSTTNTHTNSSASTSLMMQQQQQQQRSVDSNGYNVDDSDADIIDGFLENVFYLVGVPESNAPATAA